MITLHMKSKMSDDLKDISINTKRKKPSKKEKKQSPIMKFLRTYIFTDFLIGAIIFLVASLVIYALVRSFLG